MKEFWVVNVTDKNVCLSDLAITIPARTSVNLLSPKSHLTIDIIQSSAANGSLFKKQDKIKIRQAVPKPIPPPGIQHIKASRIGKNRSLVEVKPPRYIEIETPEEELLEKMMDD